MLRNEPRTGVSIPFSNRSAPAGFEMPGVRPGVGSAVSGGGRPGGAGAAGGVVATGGANTGGGGLELENGLVHGAHRRPQHPAAPGAKMKTIPIPAARAADPALRPRLIVFLSHGLPGVGRACHFDPHWNTKSRMTLRPGMPLILTNEIPIRKGLPHGDLEQIRAIKKRRALSSSRIFERLHHEIEDITYAMEFRKPEQKRAEQPERQFLRAVTWNIERGNRLDGIKSYIASIPEIMNTDVLLLNEVDIGMARSKNRNVAAEIGELLGFEHVFGNSYLCLDHGDVRDGAQEAENETGMHGNAILSRWPIRRAENFSVYVTKDKFESSERRLGHKKALWAEIETPFGLLPVLSVHLDPIASALHRVLQIEDVMKVVEGRKLGARVLLGGDLNTTTYDLQGIFGLMLNLGKKLFRGGFPHAIHHYMHPFELYERGVFETLRTHGFSWESLNNMGIGTTRYEVGTFDSESKVRDHLPEFAVRLLRHKLKPWNGVAHLKIDWFMGRGLIGLRTGEESEPNGRVSLSPTAFEKPKWDGKQLSDHDPVLVDFKLSDELS